MILEGEGDKNIEDWDLNTDIWHYDKSKAAYRTTRWDINDTVMTCFWWGERLTAFDNIKKKSFLCWLWDEKMRELVEYKDTQTEMKE